MEKTLHYILGSSALEERIKTLRLFPITRVTLLRQIKSTGRLFLRLLRARGEGTAERNGRRERQKGTIGRNEKGTVGGNGGRGR